MKKVILTSSLLALMVLSSSVVWAQQPSEGRSTPILPNVNDTSAVLNHMQALLDRGLNDREWPVGMRRQDIVVWDLTLKCAYSEQTGLVRLVAQPDDVSPEIGRVPREDVSVQGTKADLSTDSGTPPLTMSSPATYGPYRLVKSLDNGYTKVYAYITLPGSSDLAGLDGVDSYGVACNEGAFNYFGLANGSYDMECGLCTQHHMVDDPAYNDAGRWYIYRSHNPGGSPPWLNLHIPSGGFAPGSRVFMKMWVPADDEVKVYYACDGYSVGEIYYNWMTGPKANGSGNRFRRVTSMIVGGTAKSMNNAWDDIYIHNSSGDHLWTSDDTAQVAHGFANWVTPHDQVVRYDETVSIKVPSVRGQGQRK
ncbi:MAG TPA: hypothetical protein VFI02_18500 [Armatimonadota bacterium]|nr:hypothetical protein [Armatimonadota bacterium]